MAQILAWDSREGELLKKPPEESTISLSERFLYQTAAGQIPPSGRHARRVRPSGTAGPATLRR